MVGRGRQKKSGSDIISKLAGQHLPNTSHFFRSEEAEVMIPDFYMAED